MAKLLEIDEALSSIKKWLAGASFDKITYYITGWELRFVGGSIGEFTLYASELSIPDSNAWNSTFSNTTIDLLNTNEPSDVIVAAHLFSALNKWRVLEIELAPSGKLALIFENSVKVIANPKVDNVDWTWYLVAEAEHSKITCDSGVICLSEAGES